MEILDSRHHFLLSDISELRGQIVWKSPDSCVSERVGIGKTSVVDPRTCQNRFSRKIFSFFFSKNEKFDFARALFFDYISELRGQIVWKSPDSCVSGRVGIGKISVADPGTC